MAVVAGGAGVVMDKPGSKSSKSAGSQANQIIESTTVRPKVSVGKNMNPRQWIKGRTNLKFADFSRHANSRTASRDLVRISLEF